MAVLISDDIDVKIRNILKEKKVMAVVMIIIVVVLEGSRRYNNYKCKAPHDQATKYM